MSAIHYAISFTFIHYMHVGRLRTEGNATVLLGACDTFRAAAVEQLGEWARRANVSIEVPTAEERGGDPVPVVRRSIRRAVAEKFDFVIIDTSGRLSNNFELIEQLQSMKAAIQKELPQVSERERERWYSDASCSAASIDPS